MKKLTILIFICCGLFLLPAASYATLIIVDTLYGGSGDVENILYNGTGTVLGPAFTVTGRTNQTSTLVNFTSNENLIASGGQATIVAADGAFDNIDFYLQDPTLGFSKVQFNLDLADDSEAGQACFCYASGSLGLPVRRARDS